MKQLYSTLFVLTLVLSSCDTSDNKNTNKEQPSEIAIEEVEIINTTPKATNKQLPTIKVSDKVSILFPGEFGQGEIDKVILNQNWKALTRKDGKIIGNNVELSLTPTEDAWGEEGNLDGNILSDNTDSSMMYILGIEHLDETAFEDFIEHLNNNQLMPGEEISIGNFKLTATGEYSNEEYPVLSNYSIFYSGVKNGEFINHEIFHIDWYDDAMTSFYWIGDLDQDGIPDLMLDASHKYSYSNPTLYLSSPAHKDSLLKKVADVSSFGC